MRQYVVAGAVRRAGNFQNLPHKGCLVAVCFRRNSAAFLTARERGSQATKITVVFHLLGVVTALRSNVVSLPERQASRDDRRLSREFERYCRRVEAET